MGWLWTCFGCKSDRVHLPKKHESRGKLQAPPTTLRLQLSSKCSAKEACADQELFLPRQVAYGSSQGGKSLKSDVLYQSSSGASDSGFKKNKQDKLLEDKKQPVPVGNLQDEVETLRKRLQEEETESKNLRDQVKYLRACSSVVHCPEGSDQRLSTEKESLLPKDEKEWSWQSWLGHTLSPANKVHWEDQLSSLEIRKIPGRVEFSGQKVLPVPSKLFPCQEGLLVNRNEMDGNKEDNISGFSEKYECVSSYSEKQCSDYHQQVHANAASCEDLISLRSFCNVDLTAQLTCDSPINLEIPQKMELSKNDSAHAAGSRTSDVDTGKHLYPRVWNTTPEESEKKPFKGEAPVELFEAGPSVDDEIQMVGTTEAIHSPVGTKPALRFVKLWQPLSPVREVDYFPFAHKEPGMGRDDDQESIIGDPLRKEGPSTDFWSETEAPVDVIPRHISDALDERKFPKFQDGVSSLHDDHGFEVHPVAFAESEMSYSSTESWACTDDDNFDLVPIPCLSPSLSPKHMKSMFVQDVNYDQEDCSSSSDLWGSRESVNAEKENQELNVRPLKQFPLKDLLPGIVKISSETLINSAGPEKSSLSSVSNHCILSSVENLPKVTDSKDSYKHLINGQRSEQVLQAFKGGNGGPISLDSAAILSDRGNNAQLLRKESSHGKSVKDDEVCNAQSVEEAEIRGDIVMRQDGTSDDIFMLSVDKNVTNETIISVEKNPNSLSCSSGLQDAFHSELINLPFDCMSEDVHSSVSQDPFIWVRKLRQDDRQARSFESEDNELEDREVTCTDSSCMEKAAEAVAEMDVSSHDPRLVLQMAIRTAKNIHGGKGLEQCEVAHHDGELQFVDMNKFMTSQSGETPVFLNCSPGSPVGILEESRYDGLTTMSSPFNYASRGVGPPGKQSTAVSGHGTVPVNTNDEEAVSPVRGLLDMSPDDRPILGTVATHWEQSSPKVRSWNGKGIPNSTNKYKEDQKVNWVTTPFEIRLEQALAKQMAVTQR